MFPQWLQISAVVLCYWSISISLVFANKYLVGGSSTKDVSLLVAWLQCGVTVVIAQCLHSSRALFSSTWSWSSLLFPREGVTARPVLLMTCTFVAMLSFNNLCLHNVHVSFYQVARSLTLIFTVFFSVTMLKKSVSCRIFLCCLVVANGFILGVDQEALMGTLSVIGVIFGVTSSLFVALNGIFTKKALDIVEGDTVKLTFYTNLNAVILFIPILFLSNQIQSTFHNPQIWEPFFVLFLLSTGALGFLIAWISALQIHLTSPVTHHISSNTKAVLQTVIAVLYYHEHKGALWWLSVLMVVGGALAYAIIRIWEEKREKDMQEKIDYLANDTQLDAKTIAIVKVVTNQS